MILVVCYLTLTARCKTCCLEAHVQKLSMRVAAVDRCIAENEGVRPTMKLGQNRYSILVVAVGRMITIS